MKAPDGLSSIERKEVEEMKPKTELKNIIRQRRFELGMTLDEVAQKVGVHNSTVQRWETGKIDNLGRDKISSLAAALQVSPEYLLGWTDDPNIIYQENIAVALADLSQEELDSVLNYISFIKTQRRRGSK
jgi:transcriptional regulator with XRE-family HTH domain